MGIEMKPLEFTRDEWIPIQQRLLQEHGVATMGISWRCRRELGFTVRHHEEMRTFFILKYHNVDKA